MCLTRLHLFAPLFLSLVVSVSDAADDIDFNRDIRPILSGTCLTCHGPDEEAREAELRLDVFKDATADLGGYAAIVPRDADASDLINRVTTQDKDLQMPPPGKGKRLTSEEVQTLRRWINAGAIYDQHWSYIPPTKAELPEVKLAQWTTGAIDHFVLQRIEQSGLQPSPQANRETIARRVALALTGLPPTPSEVHDFVHDKDDAAYERFVDAQLAKPTFGERWARVWLDLARYADSAGYADDPARTIWAYRDYVIGSLNDNKRFDQFTIEQIAGDLLENPSPQQLIATAFHRNTMTNNEGGTNDEQFRNEAIVDRVNTTMAVWMGTTMACAQCHTHKYDPITQEEYFRFFDVFNQTEDADLRDDSPLMELWSESQNQTKQELNDQIALLRVSLSHQTPELDRALDEWLSQMRSQPQWQRLICDSVQSTTGELRVTEDGDVKLVGETPQTATFTLRFPISDVTSISALRLEVPDSQTSNFVLSRATATFEPKSTLPQSARFVRLELPGNNRFLHLAEVQVFSEGVNVALGGKASQKSTYQDAVAGRSIDGNTDGNYDAKSVSHTESEKDPWLEIDLGASRPIDSVAVWNRSDGGASIASRIEGYRVILLGEDRQLVWTSPSQTTPSPNEVHDVSGLRTLNFAAAIADYSQLGFPASTVISRSNSIDPKTGWAIAGETGKSHELNLILDQPTKLSPGTLVLRLDQLSEYEKHVLTTVNVSTTDDSRVQDWAKVPETIRGIVQSQSLSVQQRERVSEYYRTISPLLARARKELQQREAKLAAMKPESTVLVMKELPADKRRVTRVQLRGNYQSLMDEVTAGVPEVFHSLPLNAPENRLGIAKWLVAKDNPLTARVIVNRHWEEVFGIGIVETSEEFGSQGELPTHPKLLDWLSVDLMDNGWDLKELLKQMVMSATYRQSSVVTAELLEVDPDNRLYARGPRFRISAEMVRDQSLFIAGLLSDRMYGPPVRPPQPDFGLKAAFGSNTDWKTSEGDDRYRRGIYTTWRRSNPYPSMATFDAPNREVCTVRRSRTNTPLQALVTLNDPVYVEAAQAFARRVAVEPTLERRITSAFQFCLQRDPTDGERERLAQLYEDASRHFQTDEAAAEQMATNPLGPLPKELPLIDAAALTVVAAALLNLDETLMPK